MKQFISIKEKRVAAIVLFVVLGGIGLNQLWHEKEYAQLGKNMASLYQDRLMPSGYLFEINDHLYQKKILHMNKAVSAEELTAQLQKHDVAVMQLIDAYEKTYLTKDEQQHWKALLTSLAAYKTAEKNFRAGSDAYAYEQLLDKHFLQAQAALNNLNDVQAREGSVLQHNSKAIINHTVIQSYLQIAMLAIIAVIAAILLLARDNPFFPTERKAALN
nr:MCP four helix bundle domain-containing protein [uncultured Lacibacter sp.]